MLKTLKELFDDPVNFFKKPRSFKSGFCWMLFSLLIFVLMNQVMIKLGFVQFMLLEDPLTAILVNYVTLLGGYFLISLLSFIPFRLLGGKKPRDVFTVIAYSLIPLMFFWVPHILPQAIIVFLTLLIMTLGIAKYAKTTRSKAFVVPLFFLVLVIILSMTVRNMILVN